MTHKAPQCSQQVNHCKVSLPVEGTLLAKAKTNVQSFCAVVITYPSSFAMIYLLVWA